MTRRLLSYLHTAIAYDGGPDEAAKPAAQRRRVTLQPGVNVLTDEDAELLDSSPVFVKHFAAGHYANAPDKPVVVVAETAAPAPEDPRAKRPKESDKAWKARLAKLDLETAGGSETGDSLTDEQRKFVSDFYAMTPEEQTALRPTLTDEEAKLLDANQPEQV